MDLLRMAIVLGAGATATAAFLFACTGDPPAAGPASTADGGASLAPDATASLGCPAACIAPPPAGWTGPSAVADIPGSDAAPTCKPPYAQEEVRGRQGVTAPAHTCSCGAGTATTTCTVRLQGYALPECMTPYGEEIVRTLESTGPSCVGLGLSSVMVQPPALDAGCTYPAPEMAKTPETHARTNVACGLARNAPCAAAPACLDDPPAADGFGRRCIHRAGDHLCPSADYPARFVAHTNSADTRASGPCTGAPAGATCGQFFLANSNSACTGGVVRDAGVPGHCLAMDTAWGLDVGRLGPLPVTCLAGTSASTGEVSGTDPVTFCCAR